MRRTLCLMTLTLIVGACSDSDPGPSRLDIDEVRIAKVSGDQAAIAGTSQATPLHSVSASPRFAVTAGQTWTPEPLVGRIETVGARTSGISGPSMLPPDMLAHWHLPEEAGRLLAASTPPDDSLHIVNRWAPSTRAGEYTAVARRILADGTIHEDARWTLVVEPGALSDQNQRVWAQGSPVAYAMSRTPSDTVATFGWCSARDRYSNCIPYRLEATGWLQVIGSEAGTEEARTVVLLDTEVTEGDTNGHSGRGRALPHVGAHHL